MSNRLRILDMIEKGEITPEEGARMLQEITTQSADKEKPASDMEILEKIERGEISPEEGARLLKGESSLGEYAEEISQNIEIISPLHNSHHPPPDFSKDIEKWRRWWMIPAWIGITLILLGAWWMYSTLQSAGVNFWFFCAWLPLLLGILLAALTWPCLNRAWLHVRVKEGRSGKKSNVAISMPLPLGLASWGFRNFKHYIPSHIREKLDETAIDEVLEALGDSAKRGNPFYVQVDDEDGGEKVEVYIG
ncbi:hypothetical protein ACFLYP_03415 [Chloroflexota bacterium]